MHWHVNMQAIFKTNTCTKTCILGSNCKLIKNHRQFLHLNDVDNVMNIFWNNDLFAIRRVFHVKNNFYSLITFLS